MVSWLQCGAHEFYSVWRRMRARLMKIFTFEPSMKMKRRVRKMNVFVEWHERLRSELMEIHDALKSFSQELLQKLNFPPMTRLTNDFLRQEQNKACRGRFVGSESMDKACWCLPSNPEQENFSFSLHARHKTLRRKSLSLSSPQPLRRTDIFSRI